MELNLYCPLNSLGYGIASLNIASELLKRKDIQLSVFPISKSIDISSITEQNANNIINSINHNYLFNNHAPCVKIWHEFDLAERIGSGKYYAFPFFELDRFDSRKRNNLESCDTVLVSSEWAKNVVVSDTHHNDETVKVVPLGVDGDIFYPSKQINTGPYRFFNCGKWEIRKGHDILLDIFQKAFPYDENVELWMMNHNPFLGEKESEWTNYYSRDTRVKLLPRVQSHNDVANIMRMVDCAIFPSRAEGWNLEALELMACGKPIIITNYAAHTQFCNHDNSFLIDIQEKESAYDGIWFNGFGNWAHIGDEQIEQAIAYMRHCYNNRINTNNSGLETAKQFSWSNTVNKLLEAIQ